MKLFLHSVELFFLISGMTLLSVRMHQLGILRSLLQRGKAELDTATRKRLLENRRQLLTLQREHSFWYRVEQELNYSGMKRYFPFLTAEFFLMGNVMLLSLLVITAMAVWGWKRALLIIPLYGFIEYVLLQILKVNAFRKVNANLLKFLDFLGNYSITAGELTGIFSQISKYMDDPIRSALEECSLEAQTTGDSSLALLVMAEKIEHPKFKELARNMEISIRYCADFTALVQSSRKNMQEYLRLQEERKGLVREALINMLLLLLMSVITLLAVDALIDGSVWVLLWKTWPGRIAMGIVAFILLLFAGKTYQLNH